MEKLTIKMIEAGLDRILRDGWVRRGIGIPETVWEHIVGITGLGREVAAEIPELMPTSWSGCCMPTTGRNTTQKWATSTPPSCLPENGSGR